MCEPLPFRQIEVVSRLYAQKACKLVCIEHKPHVIIIFSLFTYLFTYFPHINRCERRVNARTGSNVLGAHLAASTSPLPRRRSRARQFYAKFASPSKIDESFEEFDRQKYAWHMPQHMGGLRRSQRQICTQEIKRVANLACELMGDLPFAKLCTSLLHRQRATTTNDSPVVITTNVNDSVATTDDSPEPVTVPTARPAPTTEQLVQPRTPTTARKPSKKRRFIQFCYEMMGTPPEFYPDETPCWEGKHGIINRIRKILGLNNSRSRERIRNVLTYVRDQFAIGNVDVDAGIKLNAKNSGRKRKLSKVHDRCVAKSLAMGFGLEMTTAIVNHKLGAGNEVCLSTVRTSAKKVFGGKCHNRAKKKTGNRDPDSPWAIGRLAMALQLQQQFRVDRPGPSMVGKTVVKLFDDEPYVGEIKEHYPDPDGDQYKVVYEDGDTEDLEFDELRVPEWPALDRRSILWLDEKHKKVIIGASNRHEWLFFVDPEDPDVFLAEEDGGVRMEERPNTQAKYMKECRGMFGVMMREVDGQLVGDRIKPFNYTMQKVVGPVKYQKMFWKEVRRVKELKTTGTNSSVHWKDAGEGLEGGPYQAKFGDDWKQAVEDKIGRGPNAVCCVTKLMDHAVAEGRRLFPGDFWIYHDALSSWWSAGAQEHMRSIGFEDKQIRGLGHTNKGNRYEGSLPGDTPEYMPLDSNLFSDLETSVRWNVAGTRHLPRGHPDRFDLTTPQSAWSAVSRTWMYAPTPQRIVEDINRVFDAIDLVVKARGTAVDFVELRHGRRLEEQQRAQQRATRSQRRSQKISSKPKFGDVQGLHPICKQFIGNFFDLTLE